MNSLFLGLDASTQSLSALLIDASTEKIAYQDTVVFDDDLPHYGTKSGVLRSEEDPAVVHSPPLMWVEALDLLLRRMQQDEIPANRIAAISGSGQQHGSVYLNDRAETALANLASSPSLAEGLRDIFSRDTSPVWMDSSTGEQCAAIEAALGGKEKTATTTGSAAFERFTGPQIRKFAETDPRGYEQTRHIALVSSFMAAVLAGRIAPIDHGDGAGMNLMDIRTRQWHEGALRATAPSLGDRLPDLVSPASEIGTISSYFVRTYGFRPDTRIVAWSGDNPNSVAGLGLVRPGMVAVSLGTSDTVFGTMTECRTDPRGEGHVFVSPTGDYMSLICFKNGSLAREAIRDRFGLDWQGFSRHLRNTPPGNDGKLLLPWFEPEIVPRVPAPGVHRVNLAEDDAPGNCRAVVEAQMMAMRNHAAWMGAPPDCIYATGGASANREILQIMADVHQCPVYRHEVGNSAALGAAVRAVHADSLRSAPVEWTALADRYCNPLEAARIDPTPETAGMYHALCRQYKEEETRHIDSAAS